MQIAQELAGYTLGGADLLRRAMGKKIKAEMEAQRETFIEGAVARGVEAGAGHAHLRPGGQVRRLRLQQVARRRLRAARLPDRLSEGEPPGRVLRRVDDLRPRQHRQAQRLPPGDRPARHRAAAARRQPLAGELHGRAGAGRRAAARSATRWPRSRASARRRWRRWSPSATPAGPFNDLADFARPLDAKQINKRLLEALVEGRRPRRAGAPTAPASSPRSRRCCAPRSAPPRSAPATRCSLFGGGAAEPRMPLPNLADWPPFERLQQRVRGARVLSLGASARRLRQGAEAAGRDALEPSSRQRLRAGGGPRVKLAGTVIGKQERTSAQGHPLRLRAALRCRRHVRGDGVLRAAGRRSRELLDSGKPLLVTADARLEDESMQAARRSRSCRSTTAAAGAAVGLRVTLGDPPRCPACARRRRRRAQRPRPHRPRPRPRRGPQRRGRASRRLLDLARAARTRRGAAGRARGGRDLTRRAAA